MRILDQRMNAGSRARVGMKIDHCSILVVNMPKGRGSEHTAAWGAFLAVA